MSLLNEHYHVIDPNTVTEEPPESSPVDPELEEEVPMNFDTPATPASTEEDDEVDNLLDDDKVRELLQGLDDD